jgi:hypothetical protein
MSRAQLARTLPLKLEINGAGGFYQLFEADQVIESLFELCASETIPVRSSAVSSSSTMAYNSKSLITICTPWIWCGARAQRLDGSC